MAEVVRKRLPPGVKKIIDSYYGLDSEWQRGVEQTLSKTHSCQCQAALRIMTGVIHEGERVNIPVAERCPPDSNCPPQIMLQAILNALLTFLSQNTLYPSEVKLQVQDFEFVVKMEEGRFTIEDVVHRELIFRGGFGIRGRLTWGNGRWFKREEMLTRLVNFTQKISTHWVPGTLTCRRSDERVTIEVDLAFKLRGCLKSLN
jgi:hypothetical protein